MLSCKQPTYYYYYLVRSYSSYFVFYFYRKSSCITLPPDDGRLEVFRSSMHNHCASIVWYTAVYIYIVFRRTHFLSLTSASISSRSLSDTTHNIRVLWPVLCPYLRACIIQRSLWSIRRRCRAASPRHCCQRYRRCRRHHRHKKNKPDSLMKVHTHTYADAHRHVSWISVCVWCVWFQCVFTDTKIQTTEQISLCSSLMLRLRYVYFACVYEHAFCCVSWATWDILSLYMAFDAIFRERDEVCAYMKNKKKKKKQSLYLLHNKG